MTNTNTYSIYIANLHAYNCGRLIGKWVDLNQDMEDINKQIEEIINAGGGEEIAIHDSELTFDVNEYSNIEDVKNVLDMFLESRLPEEAWGYLYSNYKVEEIEKKINNGDIWCISGVNSYNDIAESEEYLEYLPIPVRELINQGYGYYIDYETIGRDIDCEGEWILLDNGYAICVPH